MGDTRVVTVEIGGLRYPIRSRLSSDYVQALARYVDSKLHAAAEATEAGDSMKVAVVTALNIADELFRSRDQPDAPDAALRMRVEALEDLLDRALESPPPLARPGRRD